MRFNRARTYGCGFALALGLAGCGSPASSESTSDAAEGSGAGGAASVGNGGAASSSVGAGGQGASATSSTGNTGGATGTGAGAGGTGGMADPSCVPGSTQACYTGPAGTQGIGACLAGLETCNADGSAYGPCEGEVTPAPESCLTDADDDCDGSKNEEGAGCVCIPSSTAPCYTGPAGTEGIGICAGGMQICNAMGTAYGPCAGEVVPAPEDCAQPADEDCSGVACSAPLWSKIAGDVSAQSASAVAVDGAGNIYVAGGFYGGIDLGGGAVVSAGDYDVFVAKFDPSGALSWSKRFGSATLQKATSIAVSPAGEVTVVGIFAGSFTLGAQTLSAGSALSAGFVARLDSAGNPVWAKALGYTGTTWMNDVALDPSGNALVAGKFDACLYQGLLYSCGKSSAGGTDAFVIKYDAAGAVTWVRSYGDAADQSAKAIATDSAGSVLLTGDFKGSVTFGGPSNDAGGGDIFVAKLDAAGNPAWSQGYGGSQSDTAWSIAVDGSGNVILTGSFTGTVSFGSGFLTSVGSYTGVVVKLSPGGVPLWSKSLGAPPASIGGAAGGLAVDANQNVLLTGWYYGGIGFDGQTFTSAGLSDGFVAKLDPQGNALWSKSFGDGAEQALVSVAAEPSGEVVVVGGVKGTLDFGNGPLTSAGGYDAVIAKFAP